MPETPLIYKKAQIGGASALIREEGFFTSVMRRSSPARPGGDAPDTASFDAETPEVSGLLGNVPSANEYRLENSKADADEAGVRVRLALLAHAVLGFRYCLLPISALAVSRSITVVRNHQPTCTCCCSLRPPACAARA